MKYLEKVCTQSNYAESAVISLFSGVELLSLVVARVPNDKLNRQSGTTNDCKN